MAQKWNMIIDVSRCENCRNCFLVVKDEHIGNDFPGYAASQPEHGHNWIDIRRKERGRYPVVEANFMPVMCNHCDDAPCLKAARGGAVRKREDGIVIIDPQKAKGQRAIVDACPYGAVFWNEEKQIPQAWIFDAHLLDEGWTKTRIEQACPTGVFTSIKVDDEEMLRIQEREDLRVLRPEIGTRPRVYYRNLHMITHCFVAGTVVSHANDVEDCVEGAEVALEKDGAVMARATTDAFGEFKIDYLEPGSGHYRVKVKSSTRGYAVTEVEMGEESVYIGVLILDQVA